MNKKLGISNIARYKRQYDAKCIMLIIAAMKEVNAKRVDLIVRESGASAVIGTEYWNGPMDIEYLSLKKGGVLEITTMENSWTDFDKLLINWGRLYGAVCDAIKQGMFEQA